MIATIKKSKGTKASSSKKQAIVWGRPGNPQL